VRAPGAVEGCGVNMPVVLWADLRTGPSDSALDGLDLSFCRLRQQRDWRLIPQAIRDVRPGVLVFEYDYPDATGLKALQRTRQDFPSLPLFMVTEHHCEGLAVWAFRTGVRDFFVKPLRGDELATRCQRLPEPWTRREARARRRNCIPEQPIPIEARCASSASRKTTLPAVRHVETHWNEKIRLDGMGRLCGLTPFQFSRLFKREHGLSFKDFLVRYRVAKAKELLGNPRATIADVAYAAGFSDPPYFARVFRALVGVSPSAFRQLSFRLPRALAERWPAGDTGRGPGPQRSPDLGA
jgi:AraC-like DNA-binding protein/CheY-like chemotaxis protein